jgi:hypothetical protein
VSVCLKETPRTYRQESFYRILFCMRLEILMAVTKILMLWNVELCCLADGVDVSEGPAACTVRDYGK